MLEGIKEYDKSFNESLFLTKVDHVFIMLLTAIMERDISSVKHYLSDNTKYNTLVIDIDDTICFTYNRDFENSKPNKEVIDKINELHDIGWKITLFTARGAKSISICRGW